MVSVVRNEGRSHVGDDVGEVLMVRSWLEEVEYKNRVTWVY